MSTKRELPVVIAADNNFSVPFGLAVQSLLKSAAPHVRYDIYVLDDGIKESVKLQVEDFKNEYDFDISYIDPTASIQDVATSTSFPRVAFARFLIPSLLPERVKGRILYVDADVLFCGTLEPLFDIDMQGCPLAASQDINLACIDKRRYTAELDVAWGTDFSEPGGSPYFNSGVLLFDREVWNDNDYSERILSIANSELPKCVRFYDQDIMNYVCRGNIAKLPAHFAVIPLFESCYKGDYETLFEGGCIYTKDELRVALEHPVIVHYAGRKPIAIAPPRYCHEDKFIDFLKQSPWNEEIPYLPRLKSVPERRDVIQGNCDGRGYVSLILYVEKLDECISDVFLYSIKDIYQQTLGKLEICVVCSYCSGMLEKVLRMYVREGVFRVFIKPSASRFAAYNSVLSEIKGEFVQFVSLDSYVKDKSSLQVLSSHMSDSGADIVTFASARLDKIPGMEGVPFRRKLPYYSPFKLNNVLFRKSAVIESGGFDLNYSEAADYHLIVKIMMRGGEMKKLIHCVRKSNDPFMNEEEKPLVDFGSIHFDVCSDFVRTELFEDIESHLKVVRWMLDSLNREYALKLKTLICEELSTKIKKFGSSISCNMQEFMQMVDPKLILFLAPGQFRNIDEFKKALAKLLCLETRHFKIVMAHDGSNGELRELLDGVCEHEIICEQVICSLKQLPDLKKKMSRTSPVLCIRHAAFLVLKLDEFLSKVAPICGSLLKKGLFELGADSESMTFKSKLGKFVSSCKVRKDRIVNCVMGLNLEKKF